MNEIFWKKGESEAFDFFQSLTGEQAQSFFDQYLHHRNERLAALKRKYWQNGGGNENDLDCSPDSLEPLWDWAARQLHRREFSPSELKHARSLPASIREYYKPPFCEDSLVLINDIAYYLAEVLVRNLEGVHWKICNTKEKRYVDQNQPVLGGFSATGFTLGINPRELVKSIARKTLDCEAEKHALLKEYEKCAKLITAA